MSKFNNNDMEKGSRSHGKKSDKETHTPMLKIFKDMIQLEKNDPEKANLLKGKERNKKRKQYTASRSKADVINRSCDSSSSERNRAPHVIDNKEYDVQCSNIIPGKKRSKRSESTDSGISCALKRLATSEYSCIACLGIIFAITVIVAFCVVFRGTCAVAQKSASQRPSRTVFRGRGFGDAGLKEGIDDRRQRTEEILEIGDWDDSKLGRFSDISLTDFDDSSSRSLNEGPSYPFADLSRIIDINKLEYGNSSERLKRFYKKLLQTEDQIRNLKRSMTDLTYSDIKNPDRRKRSVKHFHFNNFNSKKNNEKNNINKRNLNYTAPTGFVIEKKKIMVHLPSDKKIVPKCSHAPKDRHPLKSHEHEQTHPFYKNTQRLDELLDKFLDNNLPEIVGNLNLESLFQAKKVEHTTRKTVATHKKGNTNLDINSEHFSTKSPNDFFTITSNDKSEADVILGVSTVLTPSKQLPKKSLLERVPNIRKLMQVYEDDEDNLGYDDLKEVLADDVESHDNVDIKPDRNKRSYETEPKPLELAKSNPPGVQIPNWKGPLPLYPDELNTMIKSNIDHASKPIAKDLNQANIMFTDIEYVEDYLPNKYDKLANMAQAYSDYGVLDEKKESKNEPKSDNTNNRVKISLNIPNLHKKLIDRFDRFKKVITTPGKDSNTPINNEINFKYRSLKSFEENEQEKVIGIDESIILDEVMTTELNNDPGSSNIVHKPSNNNNNTNTFTHVNDEMKTQENITDNNIFNTVAQIYLSPSKIIETDLTDSVTVSNIIENITHKSANVYEKKSDRNNQRNILNIVNLVNAQNNTTKDKDGMDLSDFFRMISTWFSSLASASLDDDADNSSTVNPIMNLKTSVTHKDEALLDMNRSEVQYPSYDSDMIDNIGHRSRVLMSVDEGANATEGKKEVDSNLSDEKHQEKRNSDLQQSNTTEITHSQVLTTTSQERDATLEEDTNLENKTVAKRSIGDSGLVFWSDLYDDEYGVKVDPLEKEVAGKNANRGKEFMKRSKNWFQDKVKSIAGNIKNFKNERGKDNVNDDNNRHQKTSHIFKRQAGLDKNDNTERIMNNFAELKAKMRTVVKEAAKAVEQTRKMQVRESNDDSVANGIMQQLVRMMSELVNFQVAQKTCVRLPPDLQNFLEWITSPNQERQSLRQINLQDNRLDDTKIFEKEKDVASLVMIQDKTEYLETIHDVQDLIQQFDQMNDEDKSKMSGVRQYLENQLEFLNKQLSVIDAFNFSSIYSNQPTARFKRHPTTQKTSRLTRNNMKQRIKRRLGKYIKHFGIKHTKSPDIIEETKNFIVYDKKNVLDKKIHKLSNKEDINKEIDKNLHENDDNNGNKLHKTNAAETKDNTKSFRDKQYDTFKGKPENIKELDKGIQTKEVSNFYRKNDELEQNDNIHIDGTAQQNLYNKYDEIENDDIVKRNLQDVYYRALNEAKKVTTVKSIDKSDSSL